MSAVDVRVCETRFVPIVDRLILQCEAIGAGAQLAVWQHGRVVIDATVETGMSAQSLLPVLSVSKGITGLCVARLVDQGELDLDERVGHYWPQFARAGKKDVTVEQALSHQAGLPCFDVDPPDHWLEEDAEAAAHLARQQPLWRPGSAFSYHPVTIGTIAGELFRRIVGTDVQSYFEREIRGPGRIDAYLGVPEAELSRIAHVPIAATVSDPSDRGLDAAIGRSLRGVYDLDRLANDPRSHRRGHPAAGGVASARGLAQLYAAALGASDVYPLFSLPVRQRVTRVAVVGSDLASGGLQAFATLFQKPTRAWPFASASAFGHEGAGGAMAFADPELDLAMAFVPSKDPGEGHFDVLAAIARHIVTDTHPLSQNLNTTIGKAMNVTTQEIKSQPAVWRQALSIADSTRELFRRDGERVLLLGCGTSAFVAEAMSGLREGAGIGLTDHGFASEPRAARDYDTVIAISRSGTTTEIIDALAAVPHGVRRVLVTAVAESPASVFSDETLVLDFADERSAVQTRFPTTVVLLARHAFGEDVEDLPDRLEQALADPDLPSLRGKEHFVFLGSGWTLGLAQEAALKVRETAQAWVETYPLLDYRHGPIAVAGIRSIVWMIGCHDVALDRQITATGASTVSSREDALIELVRAQRIAVELAVKRGLDPDSPRNLTRSIVLDPR